jgi:hypothetical protein
MSENSGPLGGGNAADITRGGLMDLEVKPTSSTRSSSSSGRSTTITPKITAYAQLDSEFMKLFGYRASAAQKAAYYKALNSQEKQFATRSRGSDSGGTRYDAEGNSVSYGSGSDSSTNYAFDTGLFLQEFVVNYASNEVKAGRALGGIVGQNYATAAQYAADMGISTNPAALIKDTISIATGKSDMVSLQNSYRDRAAIKWSAYADLIKNNPGKSLRDLTIDQLDTVSEMLDINVNNLSFSDPTINKILSARNKDGKGYIMNNAEIQSFVRKNDSRFQYGRMAQKEAVNLANSFASSFGFGI